MGCFQLPVFGVNLFHCFSSKDYVAKGSVMEKGDLGQNKHTNKKLSNAQYFWSFFFYTNDLNTNLLWYNFIPIKLGQIF